MVIIRHSLHNAIVACRTSQFTIAVNRIIVTTISNTHSYRSAHAPDKQKRKNKQQTIFHFTPHCINSLYLARNVTDNRNKVVRLISDVPVIPNELSFLISFFDNNSHTDFFSNQLNLQ